MNIEDLFSGVAVVIDDEISDSNANINSIIKQIEAKNIPVLKYSSLPEEKLIKHFKSVSFLLLDWDLVGHEGVTVPETIIDENINFIISVNDICFCPIFIFTNEATSSIETKLIEEGLILRDRPSNIFIKSKNDLKGKGKLFNIVKKWLENNASIYVLKEWEREYQNSKNRLFREFHRTSPVWPKILWENYKDDNVNPSLELGEFITRNLHSRMAPFQFSETVLNKFGKKISANELQSVIEGEVFISSLDKNNIASGDIFKISSDYYINIRANCDLIHERTNQSIDDIELYLIKGSKVSVAKAKKTYNKKYGKFSEIDTQSIVFPIHTGKIVDFRFKNLEIKKWSEINNFRIGRLLPPYINRIQQRYALYMQRQGLPRIPEKAIFDR